MNTIRSLRKADFQLGWRSLFVLVITFCMLVTGMKTVAAAETSRVAKVESVTGTVQIKKAGGSKEYKAFKSMSLNQGDLIKTGPKSSIVLSIAEKEDEITVGENTEVYISELQAATGNKQTDLKVWSGSVYIKAKPLTKKEDTFSISTPTAVMGVRGTQFFVAVDPASGRSSIVVAAGVVAAHSLSENQNLNLYPAMQGSFYLTPPTDTAPLPTSASSVIKPEDLVNMISPDIIEALIRAKLAMDLENDQFIAEQRKKLEQGQTADPLTQLNLNNQNDLARYQQNLESLVNALLKNALDRNIVSKEDIEKLVNEVNTTLQRKIDLNGNASLSWNEQQELQRQKLMELEAQRQKLAEEARKKREAEIAGKVPPDLLSKIKEQQENLAKKNEEAKQKAREEADKHAPGNSTAPGTGTGGSGGSGGSGGGSSGGGSGGGGGKDPDDDDKRTIVSIGTVHLEKYLNQSVVLPATVQAVMSDGKKKSVDVKWNKKADTSKTGTFEYAGSVRGYDPSVVLSLKVVAPLGVPITINQQRLIFEGDNILDFGAMAIPPNATVTLEQVSPSFPSTSGLSAAGPIIDFHFNGIEITQPVSISFPVSTGANQGQIGIFHKNSEQEWEYVPTVISDGVATAQVTHFSAYGVLQAPQVAGVTSAPAPGLIDSGTSVFLTSETPGATIYVKQNDRFVEYRPGDGLMVPGPGRAIEAYATKSNMRDGKVVQLRYSTASASVIDSQRISVTFSEPIQAQAYSVGVSPAGSTALSGLPIGNVEHMGDSGLTITLAMDTESLPLQSFSVKFYNGSQYVAQSNAFELGKVPENPKPPEVKPITIENPELTSDMAYFIWSTPEGTDSYRVYLNGELLTDVDVFMDSERSSLELHRLEPETDYDLKIQAFDDKNNRIAQGSKPFTTTGLDGIDVTVTDETSDSISISWSQYFGSTSNGERYRVYIRENGEKVQKGHDIPAGSPLEYTVTGLQPSTEYTLYVEAWEFGDDPVAGGKATGTTTEDSGSQFEIEPPKELTFNMAYFTWRKPHGTDTYEVYLNGEPLVNPNIQDEPDPDNPEEVLSSLMLQDLHPGTSYLLMIKALDLENNQLKQGSRQFTTELYPIDVSLGEKGPDSITIMWTPFFEDGEDGDEYRVYISDGGQKVLKEKLAHSESSYSFTELDSGKEYTLYVEAWPKEATSPVAAGETEGATTGEPEPPVILEIHESNISPESATFYWDQIESATTFQIYLNDTLVPDPMLENNGTISTLTFTGLTPGTDHYLRVKALNSNNDLIAEDDYFFATL